MGLSEDRISHLAHVVLDSIWKDDMIDYKDDGAVLKIAKKVIKEYSDLLDKIEDIVREKINKQKKNIPEGSRDWQILYKKYSEEEMKKKGL